MNTPLYKPFLPLPIKILTNPNISSQYVEFWITTRINELDFELEQFTQRYRNGLTILGGYDRV